MRANRLLVNSWSKGIGACPNVFGSLEIPCFACSNLFHETDFVIEHTSGISERFHEVDAKFDLVNGSRSLKIDKSCLVFVLIS